MNLIITNPNRHNPMAPIAAPTPPALDPPAADIMPPQIVKAGGLKKVSFGKITTKKEDTTTAYPVFPDVTGHAAVLASRILENSETFEALKGSLETDKADLRQLVTPHYFAVNHGRHEVPSSISVHAELPTAVAQRLTGDQREVLVTFQNRYPTLPDESSLLGVLGQHTEAFFRQAFDVKIVGDKMPAAHTQELIDGLQELFGRYNALDALEVKSGVKPTAEFHAARHLNLTPEQNLALEEACPIVVMVKTKGRRKK